MHFFSPDITISVYKYIYICICMVVAVHDTFVSSSRNEFLAFGPQHLPRNSDALVMEDPPESLARFFGKDEDACLCSILFSPSVTHGHGALCSQLCGYVVSVKLCSVPSQFAQDGPLTFEEACVQVAGNRLLGPEARPIKTARPLGDLTIGDLPLRPMGRSNTKLASFCDIILHHKVVEEENFFDKVLYKKAYDSEYQKLPSPYCLGRASTVPILIQYIIVPTSPPENCDEDSGQYVHILKHVYTCARTSSPNSSVRTCVKEVPTSGT